MRHSLLPFLCAVASALSARAAAPIIHQDFETDASGWIGARSPAAKVQVTREASLVKTGKGALAIDYDASSKNALLAVLPVPESLKGAKSIRLWMKAKSATAVALGLNENQGGHYVSVFWLQPDVWQRVELALDDFVLSDNANDPKDPDGKLDLDQVKAIALVDVSEALGSAIAATSAPVVVAEHEGPKNIAMDDFEVSAETPGWYKPREAYGIDDFSHPQLSWFTFGGADLQLDISKKVLAGNALQASYEQGESRFAIVVHLMGSVKLAGATHLSFDVASDKDADLILSLQEAASAKGEGPRYHVQVHVPGGGKAAHRQVAFSAFEIAEDSPADPNGKLDLNNLRSLSIVDITGAITQQAGLVNTLRIGNMAAVKTAALPQ